MVASDDGGDDDGDGDGGDDGNGGDDVGVVEGSSDKDKEKRTNTYRMLIILKTTLLRRHYYPQFIDTTETLHRDLLSLKPGSQAAKLDFSLSECKSMQPNTRISAPD